mmetsp:Transcript_30974/g.74498  ORF Transcript_30974/g.74498 Transcript_30974/m.74498 type:complete len:288 (+) Transcript_30974:559-1422(+)
MMMEMIMDMIVYVLNEYPIECNAVFFTLAVLFLKSNEDYFRRGRRRNLLHAYRRDGVLCGGVVTGRKILGGDKQLIRYSYRLPQHHDTAYVKDFVEAPNELKEHHKNIVVVLFPKRPTSGIHYGLLQILMQSKEVARNEPGIAYAIFRLCFLYGVSALWSTLGPYFFWTSQMLLYVCLYQLWRIHKTEVEATGVTDSVWKTLKRDASEDWSWSPMLEPSKSDELLDETPTEDIFLALEKSERTLGQIMQSFDPESEKRGNAFRCEKYFSLVPRCQQALQKDTVIFDT